MLRRKGMNSLSSESELKPLKCFDRVGVGLLTRIRIQVVVNDNDISQRRFNDNDISQRRGTKTNCTKCWKCMWRTRMQLPTENGLHKTSKSDQASIICKHFHLFANISTFETWRSYLTYYCLVRWTILPPVSSTSDIICNYIYCSL